MSKCMKRLSFCKNQCGIYKFYDKNKNIVYIGKSEDLYNRIYSSARYKKEAKYISVMLIEDYKNLEKYEAYLIVKYKPTLNRQYVYFDTTYCKYSLDEIKKVVFEENFSKLFKIDFHQGYLPGHSTFRFIRNNNPVIYEL